MVQYTTAPVVVREISVPPAADNLYWVKWDWLTVKWDFKVRDAAPNPCVFRTGAMNDTGSYRTVPMTDEIQFFQADILALYKYKKKFRELTGDAKKDIQQAYTSLYWNHRAFTNNTGMKMKDTDPDRRNVIAQEYLDAGTPKFHPLICGGNIIEVLEQTTNNKGEKVGRLLSFDGNEPMPDAETINLNIGIDPRIQWATIISANKSGDPSYQVADVYAFSQLSQPEIDLYISVPYPLITVEPSWYQMIDCEPYIGQPLYNKVKIN